MRIDAIPNLNSDLDGFVDRLLQHRQILAEQLAQLDKLIAMTQITAMQEPKANETISPNEKSDLPGFFVQWRKDMNTGRPQAVLVQEGSQPPHDLDEKPDGSAAAA
jgi:hypothetical protein